MSNKYKPLNTAARQVKTPSCMNHVDTPPSADDITADIAADFQSALDWWAAAGVDQDYADDATDWLAPPIVASGRQKLEKAPAVKRAITERPTVKKKFAGEAGDWPGDLPAFREWWMVTKNIADNGSYPIVAPTGDAGARIMVIVPEPEESDKRTLMAGPAGNLLRAMLAAIGNGDDAYVAAALRRHTPMPDWGELQDAGLGSLVRHHIRLVAPQRVLTFGRNLPPLLGNDTAQGAALSYRIDGPSGEIPVLSAGSLSELLRSAPRRRKFWHELLDWTDDK